MKLLKDSNFYKFLIPSLIGAFLFVIPISQGGTFAAAIGKGDIFCALAESPGDGTAHIAAADKSVFHKRYLTWPMPVMMYL